MSDIAISVENLSKRYRLGQIGATSLRESADRLWHRLRGRDPDEATAAIAESSKKATENAACGHIWALKDVSFEVERGEVLGIIGKNGAGKSTLLKILTRITEPTSGRAVMRGRVASLLEVGTGFHPELTGRENVYLSGAILGMKKNEITDRFDEIIAFAEVEKFVDTPVKRYSSGMYVRLAFAVAAHLDPEILLVDEVLAVGDAGFRRKCLGKMEDVASQGRTVLFVSHNMFAIQDLCAKSVWLDAGEIKMNDVSVSVVSNYLDLGGAQSGEVSWDAPETAYGDSRGWLKAVRVRSKGQVTHEVGIDEELCIEIDYQNLQVNGRRTVSILIQNEMDVSVLSSGNATCATITPDPWFVRPYPVGLFRTSCVIPGGLLNDGLYTVTVFVNENNLPSLSSEDNIAVASRIISFTVVDTRDRHGEYFGRWLGVVRPRLNWQTMELDTSMSGYDGNGG